LLIKAGVLKNGEKWGKTGVKKKGFSPPLKWGCPHFIQNCRPDKSNPYMKKLYDLKKCYLINEHKHLPPFSTLI